MNWNAQTSGTLLDLNGVSFVDARHGWVVGDGGVVLHTEDGGATWAAQGCGTSEELLAVHFLSRTFGCAVGTMGCIVLTTDGGQTWSVTEHPGPVNTPNLFSVHFVNHQHGWASGSHGTIIATADGGATWQDQACPIAEQVEAIHFVDTLYGWAAGADGAIAATRDGGQTWTLQKSGSISEMTGLRFADRQHGYAVNVNGEVWSTSNGGQQWQLSRAPSSNGEGLLAVDVVGIHGCCAVGNMGLVVSTDNDGGVWRTASVGSSARLPGVDFIDAAHGWAVGSGGTILHFESSVSVHLPSWSHEVAIDPMALLLPNGVYVKWVEGHHPHTPEQFQRFVRGLHPAEVELVAQRASQLREYAAGVQRVVSEAAGKSRGD